MQGVKGNFPHVRNFPEYIANLTNMSKIISDKYKLNLKNSFENKAHEFSLSIIKLTDNFPKKKASWIIADQILRSSTSVGANVAEAKSASSRRDFIKYYEISLKSANETLYWLKLIKDADLASSHEVERLIMNCQELCRIVAANIITLKGKRKY